MKRLLVCLAVLAGVEMLQAGPIIPTGQAILGNFNACGILVPSFTCPPDAVTTVVTTSEDPADISGFSLEAFLISDYTGQVLPMGDLPFEIVTNVGTGESNGIFRFGGGLNSFPFPSDPEFFGPDPFSATFSILYRNTGLPFRTQGPLDEAIYVNLVSGDTGFAADSVTNSVELVPEPEPFSLLLVGLGLLAIWRSTHRGHAPRSAMRP